MTHQSRVRDLDVAAVAEWYRYRTVACFVTDVLRCGSRLNKVLSSWPACHVSSSPNTTEDPLRRVADAVNSVVSYRVLKMEVNKEKVRFFLLFFFDKGGNASQVAEIANDFYGADYVQFWFRRFLSGIFDVKGAPRTGRPVVKNVEVERHVSSRSIAQELKINHKTILSHLRKVGFKKPIFGCHTN
ncbi:histone-lysine N-methyltransferase SETMAR [Trichonephila clavipes]|nr:histone-lysine N-methyltransferase SETMAR [Trichonephila clavipes]